MSGRVSSKCYTDFLMPLKKFIQRILRSNLTPGFVRSLFFSEKYLKKEGWFKSWYLGRPVDNSGKPIPWFTYPFVHFLEQKLRLRPMKVFEFGSGNSTIWLSPRVKSITSVESEADFYSEIKGQISLLSNVTYELRKQGENYYQKILEFKNEFDVIIIDGKERVDCAKNCIGALKEDGVIIFDNSDRTIYKEAYDYLLEQGFKKIDFRGIGPLVYSDWQTSIYYRDKNCFEI